MKIVLLGYMASGKSAVGKILANKLEVQFIDLDDFIEEKEQETIGAIFTSKGEVYFRKIEALYLEELIDIKDKLVLSLGGGTPCYANTMDLLKNANHVKNIYLKASISTLVNRLNNEKGNRPLIAHLETDDLLAEFIGKHLFERSQFYSQAETIITTDDKSEDDIIEELVLKLF